MRKWPVSILILASIAFGATGMACAASPTDAEQASDTAATSSETIASDDDRVLYALGLVLSRNLTRLSLDESELETLQRGLADGVLGREPLVDLEAIGPQLESAVAQRIADAAKVEAEKSQAYLDSLAEEEGAVVEASGMVYRELTAGDGASPEAGDTVKVHYTGTLRSGKTFDTSRKAPDPGPVEFPLGQVIPCFREGITKMNVGGTSKMSCPADLAYGENGFPPDILPGAALTFEVELIDIVDSGAADAAAPPTSPAGDGAGDAGGGD